MFDAAITAASPERTVAKYLPELPKGRTFVVGAGKAAAAMARALEDAWTGPLEGIVVTRYGHGERCRWVEVVEAGHPIPDEHGAEATRRMLALLENCTADDLVIALISGGASALLCAPITGVSLANKSRLNEALLKSGATIGEMNLVRTALSAVKGGGLAEAAWPAKVAALIISDVPGDDPAQVGSGPTVGQKRQGADALAMLRRNGIDVPPEVEAALKRPFANAAFEAANAQNSVIATARTALEAAAAVARKAGVVPILLGDAIEGEARRVAADHAALALSYSGEAPCVLLSGGETTVHVRGRGRGGRNVEYLLALAIALDGNERIHAFAADTDGIDGTEDNAGAIITPSTLARAAALGFSPASSLANNDAYPLFAALGDLIVTGPTRTNVNDFRAIAIGRPQLNRA